MNLVGTSMYAEFSTTTFEWLGYRYELDELDEVVICIRRIAKTNKNDDVSGGHFVDDCASTQKREQYSAWGDF